jgi:lysyl-tRNA synthetase class 2
MISSQYLRQRVAIIKATRIFFEEHDYLEVETPIRLPVVAPEVWIEPELSGDYFLQTSPELCMKRLLAAGHPRLFQFCRCFRKGERGRYHLPEFSMLEWYRAATDYLGLMDECEELLKGVLLECGSATIFPGLAKRFDLDQPWERMTVAEAFGRFADCDAEAALAADRYEEVLVEQIEPNLGVERPTFLYDYPPSLAALARIRQGEPPVAERFELYIEGVELANGFSELNDPLEQRQRFERDRQMIVDDGRDSGPMPERFLEALTGMPEAAGIALGIDRLVMILTGAGSIDEVVAFVPEEL